MQQRVVWSGKPYMRKTVVKFLLLFLFFLMLFLPLFALAPLFFLIYVTCVPGFFLFYYYWKSAHTYYVTENSIIITRRWAFGAYEREITLDRIEDVHVQQGLLARFFNCGSVVFVTGSRLEVGYQGVSVGRDVAVYAAEPKLVRRPSNSFLDVRDPGKVREIVVKNVVGWREVYQQQRIAGTLERMGRAPPEAAPSAAEELYKLKKLLDEGVITKEEFEQLKRKLIGSS